MDRSVNQKEMGGIEAMKALDTSHRLLHVGLRRIREMGYASTGLQELLDEAKVPKGSFYHHFRSKEDFAKEVLALYIRGERERAEKILRDGKAAPLRRLRSYFNELIAV